MRRFFSFILSFLVLAVLVGTVYFGIKYGPMLQSSVLLPAAQGAFSFQIEHEEAFRVSVPHEILVSIQESDDKVVGTGYFDIIFDPGTSFLSAETVEGSTIRVIDTDIQQAKGYARVEIASRESVIDPALRPVALITIQVDQVPANDTVGLGFEGLFTNDQLPPVSNQITPAYVPVPVMHDATMQTSEESIVAKHIFDEENVNIGAIFEGNLSITAPEEAKSAKITLIYEPKYLKILNIVLNDELVSKELLVNDRKGEVFIEVDLGSLMVEMNFANLEYRALKNVDRTGISIAQVEFSADDQVISSEFEEVNDPENNLEIMESSFVLETEEVVDSAGSPPSEEEEVEEVVMDTSKLINSCEFKDLTEIAKNKELSASQVQSIIDDICFVVKQGIMKGFDDGTFRPNGTMNRAAYAKVNTLLIWDEKAVTRANNPYLTGQKSYSRVYKDFGAEELWFYKYVISAKLLGIIKGYADGTYRPAKTINRAEAAKITTEAIGINDSEAEVAVAVNYKKGDPWFGAYMGAIRSLLGESMLITVLPPEGEVRRFEVAQLIANYLRFLER
jgi:hypothetical protein